MNPIIRATYLNEDEDEKDHYVGKFFLLILQKVACTFFLRQKQKLFFYFAETLHT